MRSYNGQIKLVQFTDFLEDLDDFAALLMTISLIKSGIFREEDVVIVTGQFKAEQRAQIVLDIFKKFGLTKVQVGQGNDKVRADVQDKKKLTVPNSEYEKTSIPDGIELAREACLQAYHSGQKVVLLSHGPVCDPLKLLQGLDRQVIQNTILEAIIQGGVKIEDSKLAPIVDVFNFSSSYTHTPGKTAAEHKEEAQAVSQDFLSILTVNNVHITVTDRVATEALAPKITQDFMQQYRNSKHPVYEYFTKVATEVYQGFWKTCFTNLDIAAKDPKNQKFLILPTLSHKFSEQLKAEIGDNNIRPSFTPIFYLKTVFQWPDGDIKEFLNKCNKANNLAELNEIIDSVSAFAEYKNFRIYDALAEFAGFLHMIAPNDTSCGISFTELEGKNCHMTQLVKHTDGPTQNEQLDHLTAMLYGLTMPVTNYSDHGS